MWAAKSGMIMRSDARVAWVLNMWNVSERTWWCSSSSAVLIQNDAMTPNTATDIGKMVEWGLDRWQRPQRLQEIWNCCNAVGPWGHCQTDTWWQYLLTMLSSRPNLKSAAYTLPMSQVRWLHNQVLSSLFDVKLQQSVERTRNMFWACLNWSSLTVKRKKSLVQ